MSKKPTVEDSAKRAAPKRVVPKRQLSKWEKESRRRRIIGIVVSVVIAGVVISGGIVAYVHHVNLNKPWHEPIVEVNGEVYDMDYFVKMLRLYQVDQVSDYYAAQYAYYYAGVIRDNELMRQAAEEEYDITITDPEIEEEFNSEVGENYDQFKEILEGVGLSIADYKQLYIEPILLQRELQEAIGSEKFPEDSLYVHARSKAVLVGTKEEARELIEKWYGDFNQIIKDYSPARYYPAGYWLVMVTEVPEEDDEDCEEGDLYINAMLLATEEKANEVANEFDGSNFAELAEEYSIDDSSADGVVKGCFSTDEIEAKFGYLEAIQNLTTNELSEPISQNYPDDPLEWLPEGIESTTFDEYAFGYESTGISDPIPDTTYSTTGGYWLIMVYEPEDVEEEEEEGLYIQAILLDSKEEAEKLKAEVEAGSEFAEVAEEHSLDSSASSGGDIGWLSLDDIESQFGEENFANIKALELDTLSEPFYDEDVSKQSGYWVIEVLGMEDRGLIEEHREKLIDNAYYNLLEDERNSEDNDIVNYLDGEDGSEKIFWALEHI